MPSFVCDACQETIKKPKLDTHTRQCRGATYSCIDCSASFQTPQQWGTHVSCISEAEKYQKTVYKGPKKNQQQGVTPKATEAPLTPSETPISSPKKEAASTPAPVQAEPQVAKKADNKKGRKSEATAANKKEEQTVAPVATQVVQTPKKPEPEATTAKAPESQKKKETKNKGKEAAKPIEQAKVEVAKVDTPKVETVKEQPKSANQKKQKGKNPVAETTTTQAAQPAPVAAPVESAPVVASESESPKKLSKNAKKQLKKAAAQEPVAANKMDVDEKPAAAAPKPPANASEKKPKNQKTPAVATPQVAPTVAEKKQKNGKTATAAVAATPMEIATPAVEPATTPAASKKRKARKGNSEESPAKKAKQEPSNASQEKTESSIAPETVHATLKEILGGSVEESKVVEANAEGKVSLASLIAAVSARLRKEGSGGVSKRTRNKKKDAFNATCRNIMLQKKDGQFVLAM